LYDDRYEKYIAAMERGEANIAPPYGFNRIIAPKNIFSPLFPLLNVKYVLTLTDISDPRYRKVMQEGQTRLYENTGVCPRAYFAERIEVRETEQEIFDTLYLPDFIPCKDGIVEKELAVSNQLMVGPQTVDIDSYTDTTMRMRVYTKNTGLLIISNPYSSDWTAKIDGKNTVIVRVNYLFYGIIIPSGDHTVFLSV